MKTILAIDDDRDIRVIICEILTLLTECEVISAENGLIGLEIAKQLQPNLILCDLNMPEMDGYGVLKELRQDLKTAKIPFIFMTADSNPAQRVRAIDLGANDYVKKPFDFSTLFSTINNFIA